MTREDANKRILLACKRTWNEKTCEEIFKALEQEPCEDAISRQDAIKAIDEKAKRIKNADTLNGLAGAVGILFDLPSVKPQESKWISCNERLPEDLEPVNITWVNHNPESYYADIKDKPFAATGIYFNGQWYWWSTLCADILAEYSHNYDDVIDDDIEIIAWQPLPEPYKAESEDKE